MGKIIKVLMERDGMEKDEAVRYYKDCMAEVREAIYDGDYEGAQMAFEDSFGLEPDFLMDAFGV